MSKDKELTLEEILEMGTGPEPALDGEQSES